VIILLVIVISVRHMISDYIISDSDISEAVNVNRDNCEHNFDSASSDICQIQGHPREKQILFLQSRGTTYVRQPIHM